MPQFDIISIPGDARLDTEPLGSKPKFWVLKLQRVEATRTIKLSAAPSYDRASSLGGELLNARRAALLNGGGMLAYLAKEPAAGPIWAFTPPSQVKRLGQKVGLTSLFPLGAELQGTV